MLLWASCNTHTQGIFYHINIELLQIFQSVLEETYLKSMIQKENNLPSFLVLDVASTVPLGHYRRVEEAVFLIEFSRLFSSSGTGRVSKCLSKKILFVLWKLKLLEKGISKIIKYTKKFISFIHFTVFPLTCILCIFQKSTWQI